MLKFINIDYDVEGSLIIGSAGGGSVHFEIPVEFEKKNKEHLSFLYFSSQIYLNIMGAEIH